MFQVDKITSLITLIMLCGCAPSEQTFGEKLQMRADSVHQIGEKWSQGDQLTKDGAEMLSTGLEEEQSSKLALTNAQAKISQAKYLIEKGQQLKSSAEEAYKDGATHPVPMPK